MKILSKHYHYILNMLAKVTDIGAVVLWLIMILEFLSTGVIIYSASLIMMYFGAIIVVFAFLVYKIEKSKIKN